MEKLIKMQDKVEYCLAKYPATRADDKVLIGAIYKLFYEVDMYKPFREVLLLEGLPSFETIRRCRQKAQAEHPEYRPNEIVQVMREEQRTIYKDYAINHG